MKYLVHAMITSLKNGNKGNFLNITVNNTKILSDILKILEQEGYIRAYKQENNKMKILLKYFKGSGLIQEFKSISKSSRRIYATVPTLIKQQTNQGCFIISTNKGIMVDKKAISLNLGGEVLCKIN